MRWDFFVHGSHLLHASNEIDEKFDGPLLLGATRIKDHRYPPDLRGRAIKHMLYAMAVRSWMRGLWVMGNWRSANVICFGHGISSFHDPEVRAREEAELDHVSAGLPIVLAPSVTLLELHDRVRNSQFLKNPIWSFESLEFLDYLDFMRLLNEETSDSKLLSAQEYGQYHSQLNQWISRTYEHILSDVKSF